MADNWSGRTWKLVDAVGEDGTSKLFDTILATDRKNSFELTPITVNDQIRAYSMIADRMADCWQGCVLLVRGSSAAQAPTGQNLPALPLPDWIGAQPNQTPPLRGDYHTIAVAMRAKGATHPSIERLEGDIQVAGVAESVVLYQVPQPQVLKNNTFLLVVVSADEQKISSRESGIAHGNT